MPVKFQGMNMLYSIIIIMLVPFYSYADVINPPKLLLANRYHSGIDLEKYWVSEKFDGVRAYWDGKHLRSRQGHIFSAPEWFLSPLPKEHLDGELWIDRGRFSELSGIARRKNGKDSDWENVSYMVFDLPTSEHEFNDRLKKLTVLISRINKKHIRLVHQYKIKSHEELNEHLIEVIKQGAEGLMLHAGDSLYRQGRNGDLLKVKKYQDAEAIVIKHITGKGKYKDMLGSILVETVDGKHFKIGSGFTDKQRKNPPKIGELITYKYYGLTKNGIPRFASFMRIRSKQ